MKKIFTLLFAVGMVAVVQAQTGSRDNRQFDQRNDQQYDQRNTDQVDLNGIFDNGKIVIDANFCFGNDRGFGNSRILNERKRDMQIARINQMFDYKIQMVKRNFRMTWFEKQRLVRSLEQQRQQEIRMVYAKFNDRNRYGNPYDRNGGYDRNDRSNGHY